MAKRSDSYEDGHKDGRAGFMQHSGSRDYVHGYRYGRQEYEYWNSHSAFDEAPEGSQSHSEADEFGIGGVFGSILLWVFIWAPIGLIFGGESTIFNIVFWGGLVFVALLFILWIVGLFFDASEKRKREDKKQ